MLALFGADDFDALEARLMRGEGPSARRLRHLAATLPVGEPARLEGMRFVVERRPINVNLRCARVPAPGGATWLLASIPALGAASAAPPPPADVATLRSLRNRRRRISADRRRRIRASCGRLTKRAVLARPIRRLPLRSAQTRRTAASPSRPCSAAPNSTAGDELVRALAGRQTFSRIAVGWPLPGSDRRRLVTLSAAPLFGRRREFLGYRGFGVLGEEIEAAASNQADLAPALAEDDQPPEIAGVEPAGAPAADEPHAEAQAPDSAAEPLEMDFVPAAGGCSRSLCPRPRLPSRRTEASRLRRCPRRARPTPRRRTFPSQTSPGSHRRAGPRRGRLNARPRSTSSASPRFPRRQTSFRFAPARSTG